MYTSNVCLSCIKNICIQYTNYTLCVSVMVVVNWYFFTGKILVYNSLDRTLILHAHDLVTNHSHPAWSGHVTHRDARDQFASGKHRDNITWQITNPAHPNPVWFTGFCWAHAVCFQVAAEARWVAGVVLDQAYLPFPDLVQVSAVFVSVYL